MVDQHQQRFITRRRRHTCVVTRSPQSRHGRHFRGTGVADFVCCLFQIASPYRLPDHGAQEHVAESPLLNLLGAGCGDGAGCHPEEV